MSYKICVKYNDSLLVDVVDIWKFLIEDNDIVVDAAPDHTAPDQDDTWYGVPNSFILEYKKEAEAREAFGALRGLLFQNYPIEVSVVTYGPDDLPLDLDN